MDTPRDAEQLIWLYGKPRFLRESLAHVLQETLGTVSVRELPAMEPPTLGIPEHLHWFIWFLGSSGHASTALQEFATLTARLNLVLIENNGNTLVRRANGTEMRLLDISLRELVSILQLPVLDPL